MKKRITVFCALLFCLPFAQAEAFDAPNKLILLPGEELSIE